MFYPVPPAPSATMPAQCIVCRSGPPPCSVGLLSRRQRCTVCWYSAPSQCLECCLIWGTVTYAVHLQSYILISIFLLCWHLCVGMCAHVFVSRREKKGMRRERSWGEILPFFYPVFWTVKATQEMFVKGIWIWSQS